MGKRDKLGGGNSALVVGGDRRTAFLLIIGNLVYLSFESLSRSCTALVQNLPALVQTDMKNPFLGSAIAIQYPLAGNAS